MRPLNCVVELGEKRRFAPFPQIREGREECLCAKTISPGRWIPAHCIDSGHCPMFCFGPHSHFFGILLY